jgi:major membrane immunogen (membrane-anchored lipoprotein)
MKKRIIAFMLCLLLACLTLTGCGSNEKTGNSNTGETKETSAGTDAQASDAQLPDGVQVKVVDGLYEWDVRGVTLRTKSNVADYIHGKAWDFKAFLKTLGWTDRAEEDIKANRYPGPGMKANLYCTTNPNNPYIHFGGSTLGFISEHTHEQIKVEHYSGPGLFFYGIDYRINGATKPLELEMTEKYYLKEPCEYGVESEMSGLTIPFEVIVYFHYICEHLAENPDIDPLDGVGFKDPDFRNTNSYLITSESEQ